MNIANPMAQEFQGQQSVAFFSDFDARTLLSFKMALSTHFSACGQSSEVKPCELRVRLRKYLGERAFCNQETRISLNVSNSVSDRINLRTADRVSGCARR